MDDASVLYLENQFCFPLYAASRLTTKLYAPLLKELELTYPQYLVLLVLWENDLQTVNEIGNCLLLESNTLTPLLKRLEQKKLIKRTRKKEDERIVTIALTAPGKALQERAVLIPQQIASLFKDTGLTEEDYVFFQQTLLKLVSTLKDETSKI
ncbi:MarR family winged helix-turn-helix transcriptional regulator [Leeuwenhoekiella marinoflava]|uniref:MarR family transcriptional regulator n=2 Tax=Leeuwenhoekiella marinoflava TaxID=988 RepID=A0A4Q0PK34_9FLAO|nr:MarR family transcriptional regulator [Leeuwenhoekiella marinoflava]RXG27246.1 MarR family transcriptional regulator [Leeuwenhoekiella marinoflava]SHF79842.1 DNA-binding transcriptional regulator, MarR family [Leeuwenhoekiella marinoflava DSM 3653]